MTLLLLYKYVPPERFDILSKGVVRFTQPGALNDPFEMQPHFHSLASGEYLEQSLAEELPVILRQEYERLPEAIRKAVSFEGLLRYAEAKRPEVLTELRDVWSPFVAAGIARSLPASLDRKLGLLCLAEESNSLLMWAHYTSGHTGFVIQFDSTHPFFAMKTDAPPPVGRLMKVTYSPTRPNLALVDADNFDVFLTKSSEWAYEREWRMLAPLERAEAHIPGVPHDVYLFRIPPEAICGVILGCRTTNHTKDGIRRLISERADLRHIRVQQARPDEQEFALRYDDVST